MEPFETIMVTTHTIACNGGGGALGHPRVYLNLGTADRVECPYCSRLYVLEGHGEPANLTSPSELDAKMTA